jgi:hypothetical protein
VPVDTRALVALSDLAARPSSAVSTTSPDAGPRPSRSRSLTRRRVAGLAAASVGAGLVCGVLVPADAAAPPRAVVAAHRAAAVPAVLLGSTTSPFTVAAKKAVKPAAKPAARTAVAKPGAKATARTRSASTPKPATAASPAVATKPRSAVRPVIVVADPRPPRAGALRTRGVAPAAVVAGGSAAYVPTRPLPARSGTGRRIVYSERAAHLWVVGDDGTVLRDYPVTGRVGRPKPGVYHVYSKSTVAINPGEKLRFEYMVRFAVGLTGARIGFHTIPRYYDGHPIQKESQLGRAIGAGGCVRQSRADALWLYACPGSATRW